MIEITKKKSDRRNRNGSDKICGKQILSRAWLEECARQQSDAPYGYCFWRGEYGSFRADGKYCQLAIMLPGRDAVVSLMAECRREAEMKRAVYDLVCAQL